MPDIDALFGPILRGNVAEYRAFRWVCYSPQHPENKKTGGVSPGVFSDEVFRSDEAAQKAFWRHYESEHLGDRP